MKVITKLNKIVNKLSDELNFFEEYEFTHKSTGINESLIWLFNERKKRFKLVGQVCDLNDFANEIAFYLNMGREEVKRTLKGQYRDIFDIQDTFGQNYIDLK